jgi:serine/threonine-protein kinase
VADLDRSAVGRFSDASEDAISSSDDGRAQLQERLALFGRVMMLLSLLGYAATNLVAVATGHLAPNALVQGSNLAHLGATIAFLVVWLVCRAGTLPFRVLQAIDVAATLLPIVLFDLMALLLPVDLRPDLVSRHLVVLLVTSNILIARSVIVPSRPHWTAALGVSAAVFALVFSGLAEGVGRAPLRVAYAFTWSLIAVLTSTFASHVIYGLRRRVREARRLGRYTLLEKLGAGGMGVVFRAEHAMLRRPTAVKLLDVKVVGEPGLARFEREVQLTAKLTHPNTIAIYDYGRTSDGVFYYAMELVDGLDLERLVDEHGPQPASRVVYLLRQACGSLAEAHAAGLVHRDIKPSNLVVSHRPGQGDVLKVLDFGLVKDVREGADRNASVAGGILGTPLYLSPEAIVSPESVSAASDVYALGAVAYWLLGGTTVFRSNSIPELLQAHLGDTPAPLKTHAPSVPRELEDVVMRCLAKRPGDRPGSAEELAEALAECGVPPWTREDAERWWSDRLEAAKTAKQKMAFADTMASGTS